MSLISPSSTALKSGVEKGSPVSVVLAMRDSCEGSVRVDNILVRLIDRSPYQTRLHIDQNHVSCLASSIEDHELSSPILVRPKADGRYELVCGEHRWEAHKLLGRETIHAEVRALSDVDAAKSLAADNLQRSELSDYEIFKTTCMLLENGFAPTDSSVAKIIGKSRNYVSKLRAFGDLPDDALQFVLQAPKMFGSNLVADLKASRFSTSHPEVVAEAFRRVLTGALTQSGVLSFIRSTVAPVASAVMKDSTFKINNKIVHVTVYPDTIRISCKGMNSLSVEHGIQQALKDLL